jgi:uncharacterized protein (TIGR04222 family)
MSWYAANTWGISGSVFLPAYLILAMVALAGSVLWWRRAVAGPAGPADGDLDPIEIAYVNDGARGGVQAALMALRAVGAVKVGRRRRLVPRHPPDTLPALPRVATGAGSQALCQALYAAVARGPLGRRPHRDQQVAAALNGLRAELRRAGWLRSGRAMWRVRLAAVPLWAVVVLGAVRIAAGLANHKSVDGVVIGLIGAAAMGMVLATGTPAQTGSATRRLRQLRRRHARLLPGAGHARGAWAGPADAVMGVALFGAAALWAADAEFAAAARVGYRQFNATGQLWDSVSRGGYSECSGSGSPGAGGDVGGG